MGRGCGGWGRAAEVEGGGDFCCKIASEQTDGRAREMYGRVQAAALPEKETDGASS